MRERERETERERERETDRRRERENLCTERIWCLILYGVRKEERKEGRKE